MGIKKINCFIVTCEHCRNHTLIKKNIWGDKLYVCPQFDKKHKAIKARDCSAFKCNYSHTSLLCDSCEQKKYIRIFKK